MTDYVPTTTWSSAVTPTTPATWQVFGVSVYFALNAVPSNDTDGILLNPGDFLNTAAGEAVRYRASHPASGGVINRQDRL